MQILSSLQRLLRLSSSTPGPVKAHITFGQTSFGRSVSRTGLFLKKQLWIWPIVALAILSMVGYGISSAIQRTMEASLESELQTLLNVETSMLQKWLQIQEGAAQSLANS